MSAIVYGSSGLFVLLYQRPPFLVGAREGRVNVRDDRRPCPLEAGSHKTSSVRGRFGFKLAFSRGKRALEPLEFVVTTADGDS
ncbi:hypothetical protein EVAR_18338_1 [Eumeta japonica]|uniref:Uncharacterized protein n=1 Tax=Eumeta variegata TaxID=151549 RepID=A0A4C1V8X8_EUMVA|nr:hypothetical protein EVAR_18338_1 [Eumeta japonica]